MKIQIQKSIKGSRFADNVVWALRRCSPSTKASCDATLTRCDDEIEIELTARASWGFSTIPARDVCNRLRREARCTILGVDAWGKTPDGLAKGATIVCSRWGAFEDIDLQESEVRQ